MELDTKLPVTELLFALTHPSSFTYTDLLHGHSLLAQPVCQQTSQAAG